MVSRLLPCPDAVALALLELWQGGVPEKSVVLHVPKPLNKRQKQGYGDSEMPEDKRQRQRLQLLHTFARCLRGGEKYFPARHPLLTEMCLLNERQRQREGEVMRFAFHTLSPNPTGTPLMR